MTTVHEIASHLDSLLRTGEITDYPSALNGIQVEHSHRITRVAAAVDARERTIQGAIDAGANLLLVHHGLFWSGVRPLRGAMLRRIRALLAGNVAVYSSHLPLDAHPELGNAALLARELGLTPGAGFARVNGTDVGTRGETDIPTREIIERADRFARQYGGSVRHSPAAPDRATRRWAICTGAGADANTLREAAQLGVDTMIVGEGAHWTAIDAEEMGITLIYAGHYATETLGVRALAQLVSETYGIPWTFLDVPTGL
ncbi:MAG: Nif3-like dinuclear metal center hexameric protein [Gemmatimonadaceae bacterium]